MKRVLIIFWVSLIIYSFFIYFSVENIFIGDEFTYYHYACNLIHGYFSFPRPNWSFVAGPGYPIVLVPFIYMSIPILLAKLLNGLFISFSIVFIYKTLLFYINQNKSLFITIITFFVIIIYDRYAKYLYTEPLTILLVSSFQYLFVKSAREDKWDWKRIFFLSCIFLFLSLTKIIFFDVAFAVIPIYVLLSFVLKWRINYKIIFIFLLGILFSIPYLLYTHSVTDKQFYYGGSNDNLYWMTSTVQTEYGDWVIIDKERESKSDIYLNHKEDIDSLIKMNTPEAENFYFKKAIENLKMDPIKYTFNVYCNVQRLFLGFPYTNKYQKPIPRILLSSIIFTMFLFFFFLTVVKIKIINKEISVIVLILTIYLGGSILLSGDMRQLFILYPIFSVWFSYMFVKFIRIKIL